MCSTSTFPSSGDLIRVRVSTGISSSAPFICNSQLYISTECRRFTSGACLDCDGRVNSSLKPKTSCHRHLLHSRRGRAPFTILKKTFREVTVEASTSESHSSESHIRKELSALDAYFDKLQGKVQLKQEVCNSPDVHDKDDLPDSESVLSDPGSSVSALSQDDNVIRQDLRSVEMYLDRLAKGLKKTSTSPDAQKSEHEHKNVVNETAPSVPLTSVQEVMDEGTVMDMEDSSTTLGTESSIVYVLAAINIAVYLFGLASPVDTAGMGASTLPLLYGAKVNEFLLNGEWWRLITPMFLHSGFFHVVLSSWALLFFGPQVENVFGPLAFCMIYFLGGLCGNMFSFFLTPAATVGGTGPLFALFSAWVVYLWLNKTVLGEKAADYGIKATTFMGVLVLCLSCLLPTDEWIHVGAILPGILFGAFAAPSLQVGVDGNDSDGKNVESREGAFAIFDSPSVLSLTIGFVVSMTLCFALYYILSPGVGESRLLDSIFRF